MICVSGIDPCNVVNVHINECCETVAVNVITPLTHRNNLWKYDPTQPYTTIKILEWPLITIEQPPETTQHPSWPQGTSYDLNTAVIRKPASQTPVTSHHSCHWYIKAHQDNQVVVSKSQF